MYRPHHRHQTPGIRARLLHVYLRSKFSLCSADEEPLPSRPLTPDNGHFLKAYETRFVGTDIDRTYDIDRQEFAQGCSMYIISLMPGEPDEPTFERV